MRWRFLTQLAILSQCLTVSRLYTIMSVYSAMDVVVSPPYKQMDRELE